jgi:myosin regulatory light chain 12
MYASLGKDVNDKFTEKMLGEASGALNFTMFLTLFSEKLTGTDPEDVIKNAFQCFDENNSGKFVYFCWISYLYVLIFRQTQ